MKQFFRAACLIGAAVSMVVIGFGSFETASAYDDYHGYRHHARSRYNHAYRHCSYKYPPGSHRFQRCMDNQLGRPRW